MADDFTGVPSDDWRDLKNDVSFLRTFVFWTFTLLVLLLLALVRKGVLSGLSDLTHFAHE